MPLFESFRNFRNRLLGSASFRSKAGKVPIIQRFANDNASKLFAYVSGFVHSQTLLAFVQADLPRVLMEGAADIPSLSEATGIPAKRLMALLRAATAMDLCHELDQQRYTLGDLGAVLIDNPGVVEMILHHAALYQDLAKPMDLLCDENFPGQLRQYWAYADPTKATSIETSDSADYTALMGASQAAVAEQVLAAIDLGDCRHLLDVGGGNASFALAAAQHWPNLRITVADLPSVAESATQRIRQAGFADRIDAVGVDFKSGQLPTGHDALSVVRILHDHDDADVVQLLDSAAASLPVNGQIIVAEPMADSTRAGRLLETYFSLYLLAMGQGRPRRPETLRALLQDAGFISVKRVKTAMPLICSVITACRPN